MEKYLKNPSRKVVIRDSRKVRIICTDKRDANYPIVSLIEDEGREVDYLHTKNEKIIKGMDRCADLFFTPEKHEGWVNIYKSNYDGYELSQVYQRKEDAESEKYINDSDTYITTIKIEGKE